MWEVDRMIRGKWVNTLYTPLTCTRVHYSGVHVLNYFEHLTQSSSTCESCFVTKFGVVGLASKKISIGREQMIQIMTSFTNISGHVIFPFFGEQATTARKILAAKPTSTVLHFPALVP